MSYTFELNNERKDANNVSGKVNAKSPVVEIFSAMTNGQDLSRFGNKADVAAKYIMELNSKAVNGDTKAVSELNEIRRFAMEPVLMLSYFQFMVTIKISVTTNHAKLKFLILQI